MNNYLNNIYCGIEVIHLFHYGFYHEKSYTMNNIGFIFNYNYEFNTIIEIFDDVYGGKLEVFNNFKKFIDDNSFMIGKSFYAPLRSLTEDERFYIILKYGEIGSRIISEHTE